MTDIERGYDAGHDEDRLPWLEAVDDDEDDRGPGAGKLIAAVVAALAVIGLVIGGVFWLRERGAESGDGELIAAPAGDYKVVPKGAGADGMTVEGEGDAAYAMSGGVDITSAIDITKRPEAPVAGTLTSVDAAAVQTKAPPPPAAEADAKPAPPAKKPTPAPAKPAATGPTAQLGAFSSEGAANTEWSKLSRQFPALNGFSRTVIPVESGGRTLYRLRVSGNAAADVCATVRAGGKPCNMVPN